MRSTCAQAAAAISLARHNRTPENVLCSVMARDEMHAVRAAGS